MKREYDRDKYIVRVNVIIDIGNDRKKFHNLLFIKKINELHRKLIVSYSDK